MNKQQTIHPNQKRLSTLVAKYDAAYMRNKNKPNATFVHLDDDVSVLDVLTFRGTYNTTH